MILRNALDFIVEINEVNMGLQESINKDNLENGCIFLLIGSECKNIFFSVILSFRILDYDIIALFEKKSNLDALQNDQIQYILKQPKKILDQNRYINYYCSDEGKNHQFKN